MRREDVHYKRHDSLHLTPAVLLFHRWDPVGNRDSLPSQYGRRFPIAGDYPPEVDAELSQTESPVQVHSHMLRAKCQEHCIRPISLIYTYRTNFETHKSSPSATNCSDEEACGEVDANRTKYSCANFWCGRFRFVTYMFVWALYCLLTFPDTSSLQGIMRNRNIGRPWPFSLNGWGIS